MTATPLITARVNPGQHDLNLSNMKTKSQFLGLARVKCIIFVFEHSENKLRIIHRIHLAVGAIFLTINAHTLEFESIDCKILPYIC